MVQCDSCDGEVREVWRHRTHAESMTHRRIEWVCPDCHPELPATAETPMRAGRAIADGGQSTAACPICSAATVNGQGLCSCTECGWTGRL
ncbi:hypothetical protein [Halomicrobium katesii]|uniref:hypothetical protein n=1 Tax=Halomicrobium katesii TaxID=437163 RepID=UPI00035D88C6|nr:hypothetical protein [Halomicrobium katesii]